MDNTEDMYYNCRNVTTRLFPVPDLQEFLIAPFTVRSAPVFVGLLRTIIDDFNAHPLPAGYYPLPENPKYDEDVPTLVESLGRVFGTWPPNQDVAQNAMMEMMRHVEPSFFETTPGVFGPFGDENEIDVPATWQRTVRYMAGYVVAELLNERHPEIVEDSRRRDGR